MEKDFRERWAQLREVPILCTNRYVKALELLRLHHGVGGEVCGSAAFVKASFAGSASKELCSTEEFSCCASLPAELCVIESVLALSRDHHHDELDALDCSVRSVLGSLLDGSMRSASIWSAAVAVNTLDVTPSPSSVAIHAAHWKSHARGFSSAR